MSMSYLRGFLALWLLLPGAALAAANPGGEQQWAATIARVSPSVVSIRVNATRAFDTDWNFTGQATGFVVDAKRGIILTNRHVVTPGPVVAEAVFQDHEVVALKPIYRDPVHDFGFYQYDPGQLKYIHPASLMLAPEDAHVGEDIRIIGNDAGEQLSILSGTLARLDREAPQYGAGGYNDFNTFYYQAVSGTSGGSSGSPVIDIAGDVIALNAGARTDASSSYFLPLQRVRRALTRIQTGEPVTRGTLETEFQHVYYDELERLGLPADEEARLRQAHPDWTGLLVVNRVLPGGPADGVLQPGDILLSVNGRALSVFVPLEHILDDAVGQTVALGINRGGLPLTVKLKVADLYKITPDSYLEFGGAVLNNLSYQQARSFNVPVRGVYLANPGYVFSTAGIGRGAVITELDGVATPDLDAFQRVLEKLPDGMHVRVRYFHLADTVQTSPGVITVDRRWFPADRCTRDDALGVWPCQPLPAAPAPAALLPASVSAVHYDDARLNRLARSLVYVNFDMPYPVDGVSETHYVGAGLIVDAKRGLVLVDRDTVPVAMGDARITFAGALQIPAKVLYLDPLHDLAVLQYDPKLIGSTPVESAAFSPRPARPGERTWLIGYQPDATLTGQETRVTREEPVNFPLSRTFRFRDTNLNVLDVASAPAGVTGVLTDAGGRVTALWASFAYTEGGHIAEMQRGIPADIVRDMLRIVERGGALRSLGAELVPISLAQARQLGLPERWVTRLSAAETARRQALIVTRLTADTPAAGLLQTGDLLLAANGRPVTGFRVVEQASQQPAVNLVVLRNGKVTSLEVPSVALSGRGTRRILLWAGAILQKPQLAASAQFAIPPTGLLVDFYNYGSPASRYGLTPGQRIVAVNGESTPDMDSFIAAVRNLHDGDVVRLTMKGWDRAPGIITLKLDLRYWPTYEVAWSANGWVRRAIH
ncbi:MAG: trypsin-like peptidase domain-containing protein [Gammaproteobacteria bacterium]|nr:trypsin-like peptidase domain-containing protein [Gammaproteobacteria bacterium]